uniref:Glycosyltransferase n=1 Tax=Rhizopus microsporus phasma-like virus 1 TaxID=3156537 RepID=A0AAT9H820_9VIRU
MVKSFVNLLFYVNLILFLLLVWFHIGLQYYYLNVSEYCQKRMETCILTSTEGDRYSKDLKRVFPNSYFCENINLNKTTDTKEDYYKYKYIHYLEHFLEKQEHMLIIMLEDDVVPIYTGRALYYQLLLNTLSLFSNDLDNFDCSKRGFLLPTGSNGNKSLCRIFSKETLKEQIQCFREEEGPIDIVIDKCQQKLGITQKRFLIVNHSGLRSTLNH